MTTVPPSGKPLPQMPAAPVPVPAVVILQPPPALVALPPGTVLEAVVIPDGPVAEAAKANVTLRTPAGDIAIRLPVDLPDNARVAIEVLRAAAQATPQGSTPAVTVRVVSVDGQPAAQVLAQLARQDVAARVAAQAPPPLPIQTTAQNTLLQAVMLPPGAAWTPAGPQQVAALGTLSAFVVQGMPPAADTVATTPQAQAPVATPATAPTVPAFAAPTGSELSVRLTSVTLPIAAPSVPISPSIIALVPPTSANPVTPAINAAPTLVATLPSAPAPIVVPIPLTPTPQPGLVLPGPQGLAAPPPIPPLTVQPAPVLAAVTGTVVNLSAAGAPIVEIEGAPAQVQLNVRANLPVGTRLTFEITAQSDPRAGALPPAPASALPLTGLAGGAVGWPTLSESISILQRVDSQAAQQLAQALPDGGPRTAAALMSFAQAMRSGDARQWPGDANLRALERSGPRGSHLASQLSDEVAALSSRARETGTEWRALPVPWNADGHIDRIALITRREGEADDESKKKSGGRGTRFLINLDLTRLGSMQLDGMFRKETRGFDLMIRTKDALSENIRHDLTGIFAASNAAMGLKGGLTFQVVKKFADPIGQSTSFGDKSGLWA